jgi:endonuclease/exonuclease/phosphatase family metal-dependent hydrolase
VLAGLAAPADAITPSVPVGSISAVSSTSFTVQVSASQAKSYRVFYSQTRDALAVANLTAAHPTLAFSSTTGTSATIPVTNLKYTTVPYYVRVRAFNGTGSRWGAVTFGVGLKPSAPAGFTADTPARAALGAYLAWSPENTENGFLVTRATNAAMTSNVVTSSITGPDDQFSPAGLTKGSTYFFRVQARNLSTLSDPSPEVHVTATATQSPITVMTYNVIEDAADGTEEGGQTIAPWSARVPVVAANIERVKPDVLAVEEAAGWVGQPQGYGGTRQVDSLLKHLPGYALARTEVPPTEHGYYRYGNYILYKSATINALGPLVTPGHPDVIQTGNSRTAAWQLLRVKATGARFLVFAPHTLPTVTTDPKTRATYDTDRENETKVMLAFAAKIEGVYGVRAIYAGDFNSDDNSALHAFNGPSIAMGSVTYRDSDARDIAPVLSDAQYNSYNGYERTPPASGDYIDHIYVSPGIAVLSWGMVVNVDKDGQFVGTIGSDHNPVYAKVTIPS